MMTKKRKTLLFIILIITLSFNNVFPSCSLAIDYEESIDTTADRLGLNINILGIHINILDGILAIITYPAKLVVLVLGLLAQSIMSLIASTGTPNGGIWLTVDNILFNQLSLTDINIFSDSLFLIGANGEYEQQVLNSGNTLLNIRTSIAQWYYAFRNLAIVVALLMLIYIGIRMAISNIAEQKAKYKAMLTNWFVGFGLIFVLQFIIIIVINLNNAVIEILAKTNLTNNQEAYQNIMNQLFEQSWWVDFTIGWASAIMYAILVIITFIVLIMFIKRFITVAFLTLLAPLITITYAMDKVGDNKSQILNTWIKEFCYNVFIQIVYALSYLIFAKIGMDVMVAKLDFGALIFAILSLLAMFVAVNIIKQIFGFDKASSLVKQIAMTTVISKTISTGKKAIEFGKDINQNQGNTGLGYLPMHMPSGRSTEEALIKEKQRKQRKEIEEEIAKKSRENLKKGNGTKRKLRRASNGIKIPIRAYKRFAIGTLIKGLGIDKMKKASRERKMSKITLNAQDILNAVLKDYVHTTNPSMTKEEFQNNIDYIENAQFKKLTPQQYRARVFLEDIRKQQGQQELYRMMANFKDNLPE